MPPRTSAPAPHSPLTTHHSPWARWSLGVLIILLGTLPVLAFPEGSANELERNRRLLERWRTDPEHSRRLKSDLRAFSALPPAQQERVRQFDRQLHDLDPPTFIRLWGVLDRFATWMEHLPEVDRQRINSESNSEEKLAIIKEVREREWIERLPAPLRKEVEGLPPRLRPVRVAELRREERQFRRIWLTPPLPKPGPIARPALLSELPQEVQSFYNEHIGPRLTEKEREQLKQAEGQWPRLPRKLYVLSERYPVYPPLPIPHRVVRHYDDLPLALQQALPRTVLEKRKPAAEWKRLEGRWPDYALAVVAAAPERARQEPLGASRPAEFPRAIEDYLHGTLFKKLSEKEKAELHQLEGQWPDYPRRLHQLARLHRLVIPGMTLPGPRELWDNALTVLPPVPGHLLRDFYYQMTPQERAALKLSETDLVASRERLKRAYYLKHLNRLPRGVPVQMLQKDITP